MAASGFSHSGFAHSTLGGGAQQVGAMRFDPREADGWGPGVAMAVGVHLLLVAALALGVSWKIHTPEAVEAEMWDAIPQVAAAPTPPPPPAPEPVRPPPVEAPPVTKAPDIVEAPLPKKPPPKDKPKPEPKEVFVDTKPNKPSKPVEKVPEKKSEPKVVDTKPVPKPSPDQELKAAADREALRKANLARMMNDLGGSSLGSSSRSAGPSAGYVGKLIARIKPNIVFVDNTSGNPTTVVEVRCAPDGRILSVRPIESSGVKVWDDAVLRALERTEVLPADETGRVPAIMQITFRPKDF